MNSGDYSADTEQLYNSYLTFVNYIIPIPGLPAGAAGAAIGGMIILGPVGLIGGAFVKGSAVTIPVGAETFVQTAEDTTMQGVIYTPVVE